MHSELNVCLKEHLINLQRKGWRIPLISILSSLLISFLALAISTRAFLTSELAALSAWEGCTQKFENYVRYLEYCRAQKYWQYHKLYCLTKCVYYLNDLTFWQICANRLFTTCISSGKAMIFIFSKKSHTTRFQGSSGLIQLKFVGNLLTFGVWHLTLNTFLCQHMRNENKKTLTLHPFSFWKESSNCLTFFFKTRNQNKERTEYNLHFQMKKQLCDIKRTLKIWLGE